MTDVLFGDTPSVRRAIGGHQNATTGRDEWLTPPEVIEALGPFDLDPCSPVMRPWPTAARHFSVVEDGLRQPWDGLVWLNAPYSTAGRWLARLVEHGDGIALLFARTETALFHRYVWPHCSRLLFLRGRLHFHYVDGRRAAANSGAPSVLIAYGARAAERLAACGLDGQLTEPVRQAS